MSRKRIASGAHSEVSIWERAGSAITTPSSQRFPGVWTKVRNIEKPSVIGINRAEEVIVTSIHWTTTESNPDVLVLTYMYHGIVYVHYLLITKLKAYPIVA